MAYFHAALGRALPRPLLSHYFSFNSSCIATEQQKFRSAESRGEPEAQVLHCCSSAGTAPAAREVSEITEKCQPWTAPSTFVSFEGFGLSLGCPVGLPWGQAWGGSCRPRPRPQRSLRFGLCVLHRAIGESAGELAADSRELMAFEKCRCLPLRVQMRVCRADANLQRCVEGSRRSPGALAFAAPKQVIMARHFLPYFLSLCLTFFFFFFFFKNIAK